MLARRRNQFIGLVAFAQLSGCVSLPFMKWQGDGKVTQNATGSCLDLTPENKAGEEHRVRACEAGASLTVVAAGREFKYKKSELQQLLRERIFQFVRTTPYPIETLKKAVVELWLESPALMPEAAHFVVVVLAKGGNFRARLPLDSAGWRIEEDSLALLGSQRFPTASALRAGQIVVSAKPHVTSASLREFLGRAGVPLAEATGGATVVLQTGAFAETKVAKQLAAQRDSRLYVQEIELIPAAEPDGARAMVTSFSDARTGTR